MEKNISKKRKFVAHGVFKAELNEFLTRELAEDGYSGVEVRVTPIRTEIIILATRTQSVLGPKGRRIKELTSLVQKRFGFPENSVELYVERVVDRGLCAIAQAMKFVDGFMIHSGSPVHDYVDFAVRHVEMRQGILGIKVKIMHAFDETGKKGPRTRLPDVIHICEPKDEVDPKEPWSENKTIKPPQAPPQAMPQPGGFA